MKDRLDELQIAAGLLTNYLPFFSKGLCNRCVQILGDRIRSLDHIGNDKAEPLNKEEYVSVATTNNREFTEHSGSQGNYDMDSVGSWCLIDIEDTNPLGCWINGVPGWSESETSTQLDDDNVSRQLDDDNTVSDDDVIEDLKVTPKALYSDVTREKYYIYLERVNGSFVNILEGLELHRNVFNAVEQKMIVDFVHELQELGENGKLKERTYTAPQKWMRGKGGVTLQFGCCYKNATDKFGNSPGILRSEMVDPLPHLFKVMIKRLIKWHVLPPTCIPDSCIVNVYDEGDFIPPHVDSHDFWRPFCIVSFVSECDIVFGLNLKIEGSGEFSGARAIPLPVGSALVIKGHSADVAKHCVPAVRSKRISITFRKMDESKWPTGFTPEPDLQGLSHYRMEQMCPAKDPPRNITAQDQGVPVGLEGEKKSEEDGGGIVGPEPRFIDRRRGTSSSKNKLNAADNLY